MCLWYPLFSLPGQAWTGLAALVTLDALFKGVGAISLAPDWALSRGRGL